MRADGGGFAETVERVWKSFQFPAAKVVAPLLTRQPITTLNSQPGNGPEPWAIASNVVDLRPSSQSPIGALLDSGMDH